MKHIRITENRGPFCRGQRGIAVRETDTEVWMKGKRLRLEESGTPHLLMEDVVYGPIPKEFIEEYVPEPPEKTLDEKIKAIWPPKK